MSWHNILVAALVMLPDAHAKLKTQAEFVELREGFSAYVEHRPASNGKPTLFLLNGLTWSTREWRDFADELTKLDPEIGLVLWDMDGMGRTLLRNWPIRGRIDIEDQVQDLILLREKLGIQEPVSVAGLSYGGAVALLHSAIAPAAFDNVIAIAPFLRKLRDQDEYITGWVRSHRLIHPFEVRTDDELYDFYLRILVYTTYPLAEPIMLEHPYRPEGVFRMVQGARKLDVANYVNSYPPGRLHLIGAIDDRFVKDGELQELWRQLPAGVGASYLRIEDTDHKIPQQRPHLTAAWVLEILKGRPELRQGLMFKANPLEGKARGGGIVIPFKKAGLCANLLSKIRFPF